MGKLLLRLYPEARLNVWFEFEDDNGYGHAQADALVLAPCPVVIECKLTRTPNAELDLKELLLPLCGAVWPDRPWRTAEICRNWRGEGTPVNNLLTIRALPPGTHLVAHLPDIERLSRWSKDKRHAA